MKSGRVIVSFIVFTGLAVGGIFLLKKYVEGSLPWSTTSPRTQGNLTFLGVYSKPPEFINEAMKKWFAANFWGHRWAFFRYDRGNYVTVRSVQFEGKNVPPINLIEFKVALPADGDAPFRYFAAAVPEQYAPGYQNGCLVLRSESKEVGRWQIIGMPKPSRQIPENEPYVLTGEAVGCRFALESPVPQLYTTVGKSKERLGCSWEPMVRVSRPASDPADKYQILVWPERSTWFKWPATGEYAVQLPENGLVRASLGLLHEMPCDRIAFATKVQKYRTLDETVVLKNLVLSQLPGHPGRYVLKSCSNPLIQTKGGFEAEVEIRDYWTSPFWKCFTINLKSDQPYENAILEKSPLYQQTKKPITITCLNWQGSWSEGNRSYWGFKLPPNRGEQTIRIPEFKLKIRQTAVLEEKTLHFLAPTKEVVNATKPGKQNKAR